MGFPNRRQFMLATAGFGAIGGAGGLRVLLGRSDFEQPRRRPAATVCNGKYVMVSGRSHALGTRVAITAMHRTEELSNAAIDAAFAEIELVEDVMSIYRPQSQLSTLNREGRLRDPHPHLLKVLRHAQKMGRETEGAFDVTVQPLWLAYAAAKQHGRLPTDAEIEAARSLVDWKALEVTDAEVRLHRPGMAVTLNGIAQGFAADQALAKMKEVGVDHGLIDTGELAPIGKKEGRRPWIVGIQHPRHPEAYVALTELFSRCMATSGDYETTFTSDCRLNHLVDPQTGRSPEALSSVSILGPTAMSADALSTACFVLGPERSMELIKHTAAVDALFVLKDGTAMATPGFPCMG